MPCILTSGLYSFGKAVFHRGIHPHSLVWPKLHLHLLSPSYAAGQQGAPSMSPRLVSISFSIRVQLLSQVDLKEGHLALASLVLRPSYQALLLFSLAWGEISLPYSPVSFIAYFDLFVY